MQPVATAILALLSSVLHDEAGASHVAVEPPPTESGWAMFFELASAAVAEPERVAAVLATLKLAPTELGRLDAAEAGELAATMRDGQVALGG
jgi:hypothetical protein